MIILIIFLHIIPWYTMTFELKIKVTADYNCHQELHEEILRQKKNYKTKNQDAV